MLQVQRSLVPLKALKGIFYVTMGRLLGFIVSKVRLTINSLKVQTINKITLPKSLCWLQRL